MYSRYFSIICITVFLNTASIASIFGNSSNTVVSKWRLETSVGFEASLFIGALGGDPLSKDHYSFEINLFNKKLPQNAKDAIKRLHSNIREDVNDGQIVGILLINFLVHGKHQTLSDAIKSLEDPDYLVKKMYEDRKNEAHQIPREILMSFEKPFLKNIEDFRIALTELQRAGFTEFWTEYINPQLDSHAKYLQLQFENYAIIEEQQKLIRRKIDEEPIVYLLHFNQPFGIKIYGAHISHHSWGIISSVRNASHELLHPPFNLGNDRVWKACEKLKKDRWVRNIIENRDKQAAYKDFNDLFHEASVQALAQIVMEKLGVAPDPAEYWRQQDNGQHMLAAAIYSALKEYPVQNGDYEQWVISALTNGLLSPEEVKRRATKVVGEDFIKKWELN